VQKCSPHKIGTAMYAKGYVEAEARSMVGTVQRTARFNHMLCRSMSNVNSK